MKKRSLFAAVAMLIVSAIVLTSATYAWFATGGSTSINTITGKVAEASAGIRLRTIPTTGAAATGWVNSLDYAKLAKDTTNNHFATNYTTTGDMTTSGWAFENPANDLSNIVLDTNGDPYTYRPISTADPRAHVANTNETIFSYQLAANGQFAAIDSSLDMNTFYDSYQFYVATLTEDEDATTNDTDINMTLTIGGTAAGAARVAVYSYDGSTWTNHGIYSGAGEGSTWFPLVEALDFTNFTYSDTANNNYILDGNDTSTDPDVGDKISTNPVTTTSAATAQTIRLNDCHVQDSAAGNKLVKIYVWLEGNDSDCAPTNARVPGGTITVEYGFTIATTPRS